MNPNRILAVALAVLIASVGLWAAFGGGLFGNGDPGLGAPPVQAPSDRGDAVAVDSAGARLPEVDAPAVVDAGARVAVAVDAGSSGAALLGRVVDDKGQAIAGAEIACTPNSTFSIDGADGADFADLAEGFDPDAMAQRARREAGNRVAVRTDADGRFRIAPQGTANSVSLRVKARGHQVLDRSEPRPTADIELGDLRLQRGAIVGGRVVDYQGKPVARARVTRGNDGGMALDFANAFDFGNDANEVADTMLGGQGGVTDADGHFELAHLGQGEFVLQARHPDHPTARTEKLNVRAGAEVADVLITLAAGATIAGKVTGVPEGIKGLRVFARAKKQGGGNDAAQGFMAVFGGDSGDLLADAGMSFGERSARPAADGEFTLRGLTVGQTYQVWSVQSGRGLAMATPCSQRVEVPAGNRGVELRYDTGITVTCTVVDASTGAPIEQLWVKDQLKGGGGLGDMMAFLPGSSRSKSYPDGFVAVANLRPKKKQSLSLAIDAIGYVHFERADIALPQTGTLDLGTVRLEPAPRLRVLVVEASGGRPVANVKVRLQPSGESRQDAFLAMAGGARGNGTHSATTDADGRCTLNAIANTEVVLTATSKTHAPCTSEPMSLPNKGDGERELRLCRGGSVDVTVLDPDGAAQKGVTVAHKTPSGDDDDRETDAAGIARFERLAPGEHGFRLDAKRPGMTFRVPGADGNEAPYTSITVVDEQGATLELRATPHARLRGVVRENGIALAGARVTFVAGVADDSGDVGAAVFQMAFDGAMGQMGGADRRMGSVRTDDDGAYSLTDLQTGEHRLRVTHRDRAMPTVARLSLRDGENVVDVDLETSVLRGHVRDGNGQPVAKAKIKVRKSPTDKPAQAGMPAEVESMMDAFGGAMGGARNDGGVATDADGSFELKGVEPDVALVVQATAKGFAPATSASVQVARGATKNGIEITLGAAGTIKVTVADAPPFSTVRAKFLGDGPGVKPVVQMLRGSGCTLEGLCPGQWEVTLQVAQFGGEQPPQSRTVVVAAGATAAVDF